MTDNKPPSGQRFSHTYMGSPELMPDSVRMRRRIGHLFGQFYLGEFGRTLAAELGIPVRTSESEYAYYWAPFLEKTELRDVLDAITIRYKYLKVNVYDATGSIRAEARERFLAEARRIFVEERVRYRIDNMGGVHFTVDAEFERSRVSTLTRLGLARYAGVRELFEASYISMDGSPPDGKAGIRNIFFAAEGLFRLMHPSAPQLNASELQKHLKPKIDVLFDAQKPAVYVAHKQLAAFKERINGAHFYRHEPGTEEPAQPPLDLSIYMISQGAAHIRWLAQLDATSA